MEHAIRVVRMEVVGLLGIVYTVNVHYGIRVLSDVLYLLTSSECQPPSAVNQTRHQTEAFSSFSPKSK